jgi:hypothetical protein
MTLGKTLAEHLTDCLGETRLHLGVACPAATVLAQALADDPLLTIEAQELIESGVPVEQRDHLTRWRNSLLRQALDTAHVRDSSGGRR